jgi:hypothetical protein
MEEEDFAFKTFTGMEEVAGVGEGGVAGLRSGDEELLFLMIKVLLMLSWTDYLLFFIFTLFRFCN